MLYVQHAKISLEQFRSSIGAFKPWEQQCFTVKNHSQFLSWSLRSLNSGVSLTEKIKKGQVVSTSYMSAYPSPLKPANPWKRYTLYLVIS